LGDELDDAARWVDDTSAFEPAVLAIGDDRRA
jgi:hypothetical protein